MSTPSTLSSTTTSIALLCMKYGESLFILFIGIQGLSRLDVNCLVGQTNSASLVARGHSITRNAVCYSNLPNQVFMQNPGPFKLMANSLNEVITLIRPDALDGHEIILNIVDIDTRTLMSSWLMVIHTSLPTVTKVFDIKLPKGKSSNKRVSYTNPFLHPKILSLRTDSPDLVQFKESVLHLEGGSTQFIGMRFAPCSNLKTAELLVFLNNELDVIEECLCVKIRYE